MGLSVLSWLRPLTLPAERNRFPRRSAADVRISPCPLVETRRVKIGSANGLPTKPQTPDIPMRDCRGRKILSCRHPLDMQQLFTKRRIVCLSFFLLQGNLGVV